MYLYFTIIITVMKHCCKIMLALATCLATADATAADKEEYLPYGNMNSWTIRKIKESGVIGGDTKTLYEVGPNRTITGNTPYTNGGGSPWGTSNVMAKVMGVVKTNNSVYRDRHGSGYCAKLETHIEKVRVLGLMNMKVLAAGSLFLGDMKEPITGTKDGPKAMNNGIRFTKKPKAIKFDYKVKVMPEMWRTRSTGFGRKSQIPGQDSVAVVLLLEAVGRQRRKCLFQARGDDGAAVFPIPTGVGEWSDLPHHVWRHPQAAGVPRLHAHPSGRALYNE